MLVEWRASYSKNRGIKIKSYVVLRATKENTMKNPVCWCGSEQVELYKKFKRNRFKAQKPSYKTTIVVCKSCQTVRMLDNGEEGDPDYEASYTYEAYSPRHAQTLSLIDSYAEGDSILDIGANTGLLLHEIKNRIPRITRLKGVDVDTQAIEYGKKKYGIDLEAIDAAKLEGQFDNIVLAHTLEHIFVLPDFLNVLDKLLKPGGRVFIAVPNIEALGASNLILPWWPALQPAHHVWYFSGTSLTTAFSQLKPTWKVDHVGSFPIWKPRPIPGFIWNNMVGTDEKMQAFMQAQKGDQLDFIIQKKPA